MSTVKTIKLRQPVAIGSEEITELNFAEVQTQHVWDVSLTALHEAKPSQLCEIASKLTGVSVIAFKKMGGQDLGEVMQTTGELLGNFLGTGETA